MMRFILCAFVLLLFSSDIFSQADNTLWASVRIRILPDDKSKIDISPISRFHENYSDYRNSSIDYTYSRKISSLVTLGLTGRTWFLKEGENGAFGKNRQFVWPFVSLGLKSGKTSFNTRFMAHWALDLDGVQDRDFFRVKPSLGYPLSSKLSSSIAVEPWYQFDDENRFARIRYELGLAYKITAHLSFSATYRREEDKISPDFDMMVVTLTYLL